MRFFLTGLILVFLLVSLSSSVWADVKLTFNPPDSVSFSGVVFTEIIRTSGDKTTVDTSRSYTSHLMTKSFGGHKMVTVTDSSFVVRDGKKVDDPLSTILANVRLYHVLNDQGICTGVFGYDALLEKIDTVVDSNTAAQLKQRLDPQQLAAKEKEEWNSRIARFNNAELPIDSALYDKSTFQLPTGGEMTYYSATELLDTLRLGSELAARIRVVSNIDPAQLQPMLGYSDRPVEELFQFPDTLIGNPGSEQLSTWSVSERVIEVKTLLIHSEVSRRVVTIKMPEAKNRPALTRIVETKRKQFSF